MLAEMTPQEVDEWRTREVLQSEIADVMKRAELTPTQATEVVKRKYGNHS
jgi:hypothetical protein